MSNSAADQVPEKSSFTRKCSLLSQYLKEKGSFGDINLGLARKPESSLGVAGNPEPRGHENRKMKGEPSEVKTFDFIQKLSAAGGPSTSSGGTAMDADLSEPASVPDPRNSQLTIFFSGKVIVYDEFPMGKAQEIMEMAKQATPSVSHGAAVAGPRKTAAEDNSKNIINNNNNNNSNNNSNDCSKGNGKSNGDGEGDGGGGGGGNGDAVIPDLNEPSSSEKNSDANQTRQHQVERIARRASLHRFFAKRKERAAVRAPYQVNQNAGLPPKPEEASPRLEQGQSSRQVKNDTADVPRSEGHTDKLPEEKGEDVCMKDLELRL